MKKLGVPCVATHALAVCRNPILHLLPEWLPIRFPTQTRESVGGYPMIKTMLATMMPTELAPTKKANVAEMT